MHPGFENPLALSAWIRIHLLCRLIYIMVFVVKRKNWFILKSEVVLLPFYEQLGICRGFMKISLNPYL